MMTALLISVTGLAQAPGAAPVSLEGKDLKVVPGPLVPSGPRGGFQVSPGDSRAEAELRASARRGGTIPTVDVPPGDVAITHWTAYPAGWQGYRVEAGPNETVKVRLRGTHEAWFTVRCMGKMGQLEQGMLQNRIKTGNPEASYINPKNAPSTVYFVVDVSGTGGEQERYTLTITHIRKVEGAK
jgi:hypothetical protein